MRTSGRTSKTIRLHRGYSATSDELPRNPIAGQPQYVDDDNYAGNKQRGLINEDMGAQMSSRKDNFLVTVNSTFGAVLGISLVVLASVLNLTVEYKELLIVVAIVALAAGLFGFVLLARRRRGSTRQP